MTSSEHHVLATMAIRYWQNVRGDIEIFPSRLKLLVLLVGSVVMTAASCFVVVSVPEPIHMAIGLIGIAFFGVAGLFCAYRLLDPRPAVRLTPDGIYDSSSLIAAGFVAWSDIEFVAPFTVERNRMLGFDLKDPASCVLSKPWPKCVLLRLNLRMGFPVFSIPEIVLPGRVDDLMIELVARYPVRAKTAG